MTLRQNHPVVVLLVYGAALILTMATHHPLMATLSFLFALLTRVRLQGWRKALGQWTYLLPMVALITVFNVVFNDAGMTPLFYIGERAVTLECLIYGLVSGILLSAVLLWFQNYHDTMASGRFLAVLGKRLPVLSMMVSMVFRYIPDTVDRGREIDLSRRALMGGEAKRNVSFIARMVSILMAWSMENALMTSDAMKAKGYDQGRRRPYARVRRSPRDIAPTVWMTVALTALVIAWARGASAFIYYPVMCFMPRALEGGRLYVWLVSAAAVFATPLLLDAGSHAMDRVRAARAFAPPVDPYVRAMWPEADKEGIA
ncbi:MAG: energy-coupling factor transporter transmembrane component T family protein [Saccharofermentanales bacterium]|jgi:energy-coupling factor transport system permease protein